MKKGPQLPPLDPEIASLLARGKVLVIQPDHVKARAVARARASLSGAVSAPLTSKQPLWPRVQPALAAGVVLTVAVAAAAAFQAHRAVVAPDSAEAPPAVAVSPEPRPAVASNSVSAPVPAPAEPWKVKPGVRPAVGPSQYALELRLLRQARAAIERGAFVAALVAINEHARRMPSGRLAEEREALRVRSLSGLRRSEDARRAADAFRERFPRSVLLPRIDEMAREAEN